MTTRRHRTRVARGFVCEDVVFLGPMMRLRQLVDVCMATTLWHSLLLLCVLSRLSTRHSGVEVDVRKLHARGHSKNQRHHRTCAYDASRRTERMRPSNHVRQCSCKATVGVRTTHPMCNSFAFKSWVVAGPLRRAVSGVCGSRTISGSATSASPSARCWTGSTLRPERPSSMVPAGGHC